MDELRTERLVGTRPLLRDADELNPMLPPWDPPGGARARLVREMAHWRQHRCGRWIWRCEGRVVGMAGLLVTELEGVELAWFLDPAVWGSGYATEAARASVRFAFDELGLESLTAKTEPTNLRSLAVMQRLGMTYERDLVHADLPHVLYRLSSPNC